MLLVIIWIGCAVACSQIAKSKGKSPGTWAFLGLVFGIFAVIAALVLPAKNVAPKSSYVAPQPNFPTPKFNDSSSDGQTGFPQPRFNENKD